jgi:hypothetical protein
MEGFRSLVAARAVSASPKKAPVLPMTATVVTPSTANNGHAQPPRPASALSSQPAPKLWVSPLGTAPVMAAPLAPSAQAPQRTSPPESTEEDEMEGVEACVLTVDTSIDSNDSY